MHAVPDLPAADLYVPPTPIQREAVRAFLRQEPIADPIVDAALMQVEQNLEPIDLAQIELARVRGEQSPSWDTISRILAVALARHLAARAQLG